MLTPFRSLDPRAWSVATRSAPLTIQVVFVAVIIAHWLLGNQSPLVAVVLTVAMAMLVGGVLVARTSAMVCGIGLGLAGSAAVTLVGGVGYVYWIF
jgi:hypothetical protein